MVYKLIQTAVLPVMDVSGLPLVSVSTTPAPGRQACHIKNRVGGTSHENDRIIQVDDGQPVITVVLVDKTGTVIRTCGI